MLSFASFRELRSASGEIRGWWGRARTREYWFAPTPIGLRTLFLAGVVLWFAFFAPGFWFWLHEKQGWAQCIYGGGECASSFVGYLAITLTIGGVFISLRAILDTADAVKYAAKTLNHQQTGILATQLCTHTQCEDKSRRKDLFVIALGQVPLETLPGAETGPQLDDFSSPIPVDFLSVGMAPVLSATIRLNLRPGNGSAAQVVGIVNVGTLASGERLHVNIRVLNALAADHPSIVFDDPKHERIGTSEPDALEFHPSSDALVPQVTYADEMLEKQEAPPLPIEPTVE